MNFDDCECSDESIGLILSIESNDLVEDRMAHHVAKCKKCQHRLEVMAATPDDWKQASQMLVDFEYRSTCRSDPSSRNTHAWVESMAKQILTPASHPELLGRIGRYDVERLLGSGGMGIVFKAIDSELNRPVAIKVLAPYLANLGTARQRFAREAKAAAAVVHEHVVPIHTVESEAEAPFLVMHYVAGESLQARLDREGALEIREILRIGTQVASGLAAAHNQGLIHRDIKPSNILLEQGVERSLITDFGLARSADDASLTNTGYHAGTPQYMSPEQARGDAIDARSDLFSFGSMLYAMCTGRPPFRAETAYGILRKITDTSPRDIRELNPDVPLWMCEIIQRLMSKEAFRRYQSAEEVSKLLAECLAHVQQPNAHHLPESLIQHHSNSRSYKESIWWAGLAIVVVVLTIVGAVWDRLFESYVNPQVQQSQSSVQSGSDSTKTSLESAIESSKPRVAQPIKLARDPSDDIRDSIRKAIELQCNEVPLKDVFRQIAEKVGVEIDVRVASLVDIGIEPMLPTTLNAKGPATELLHRICSRHQLAYIVRESNLEIVSFQYAHDHPVTRFYDCAHVLPDSKHIQSLIYAIEFVVEPHAWQSQGGQSSISLIESALVIRATESMHREIEKTLAQVSSRRNAMDVAQKTVLK